MCFSYVPNDPMCLTINNYASNQKTFFTSRHQNNYCINAIFHESICHTTIN